MLKYVSRQNYTIPGKSTITINFVDPMNYYRVVNSGNVTIYGGTVTMPTRKLYDFKVPAYNAKMYAEENVRKQLYLYNDGTEEATVLLYAFRSQFEPTVLALCDAIFNDTENTVSVEINGFTESLPTGNNKIGKVDVESLPTELDTKLANILTAFNNLLSPTPVNNVTNLSGLLYMIAGLNTNYLKSFNGNSITSGTTHSVNNNQYISEISFISNDGGEDLTIEGKGYSPATIVLKSGEVLNNVKCYFSSLKITGNNVPYRLLYNVMER